MVDMGLRNSDIQVISTSLLTYIIFASAMAYSSIGCISQSMIPQPQNTGDINTTLVIIIHHMVHYGACIKTTNW